MTGVVSLVMKSPLVPLSLAGSRVRPAGADGMAVSMVSPSDAEGSETLPAISVSVLVSVRCPAARVLVVIVQALLTTVAVPTLVLPS